MLFFGCCQIGMDMSGMDSKADCPFGGHSMTICQMNPMEHIQEWQSMFTMLPTQNMFIALFLLLAFLFIRRSYYKFFTSEPVLSRLGNCLAYLKRFQLIDPFKEAFSAGILNPKLFSTTVFFKHPKSLRMLIFVYITN